MSITYVSTNNLVKFLQCPDIVSGKGHFDYWPVKGDEDGSLKIYPMIGGYIEKSSGRQKWMVNMYFEGDEGTLKYSMENYPNRAYFLKGEITSPKEAKRWIAERFNAKV